MKDDKESVPPQDDHEASSLKEMLLEKLSLILKNIEQTQKEPDPKMQECYTEEEIKDILNVRLSIVNAFLLALEDLEKEDEANIIIVSNLVDDLDLFFVETLDTLQKLKKGDKEKPDAAILEQWESSLKRFEANLASVKTMTGYQRFSKNITATLGILAGLIANTLGKMFGEESKENYLSGLSSDKQKVARAYIRHDADAGYAALLGKDNTMRLFKSDASSAIKPLSDKVRSVIVMDRLKKSGFS